MKYADLVGYAAKLARKNCEDDRYLVVALRIRGGNVISHGTSARRHVRGCSYFVDSLHAEADLIRKSDFDLDGDKIYVYRFNRANAADEPGDSRPCTLCAYILHKANAGRVYYMQSGVIAVSRPANLPMVDVNPAELTKHFVPKFSTQPTRQFVFSYSVPSRGIYGV